MEQTAVIETEGGRDLYQITSLPPDMLTCVNATGAARLLNRNRQTMWEYARQKRFRSFNVAGNVVIPLMDIAVMLGVTETQAYNIAISYRLPVWQIYTEEM